MSISIAHSTAPVGQIGADLQTRLDDPSVVVFFASSHLDPAAVTSSVAAAFEGARVFGCTTAGELISGTMAKDSIVAMGIGADVVSRAFVDVVEGIHESVDGIDAAFAGWERQLGQRMLELDPERWVGIVLADGLAGAEEHVMDRLGNLTDVTFIGGSAGDDVAFARTFVSAGDQCVSNAVVLALLECPNGFDVIKTQSFRPTDRFLTPTRVDKPTRTVLEFDGKPASAAYADALGVPVAELPDHFQAHPLGLMASGEPFVRSPQQVIGDSVRFYCSVDENLPLAILDSTDIVEDTAADLEKALRRNGAAAGVLNFNCILRTLELEQKGETEAYGTVFAGVPTVGFSTYGEEYVGHINQTATMLMFR